MADAVTACISKWPKKYPAKSYRVLLYHSVGDIDPRDNVHTRVSEKAFKEQMSFLDSEGYNVMDLADITKKAGGPKVVALTFDDGYKDNLEKALPVMERYGFGATIFVTVLSLGTTKTKRSWEGWEYLSKRTCVPYAPGAVP